MQKHIWIGIIAIIKLINVIFGIKQQNSFIAIHSVMNKIAGGYKKAIILELESMEGNISKIAGCNASLQDC